MRIALIFPSCCPGGQLSFLEVATGVVLTGQVGIRHAIALFVTLCNRRFKDRIGGLGTFLPMV